MTSEEFWNGEPSLLYAYIDAYQDRVNEEAWLFGLYTHIAVSTSLANAFMGKGKKAINYQEKPIDFKQQAKISNMTKQQKSDIARQHFNHQAKLKDFLKIKDNK